MRTILFRGKRADTGEWVKGAFVPQYHSAKYGKRIDAIFYSTEAGTYRVPVQPESVGQYIGLEDKNDTKVFEGDVISYNGGRKVVKYDTSLNIPCFCTGIGGGSSTMPHPYKISKRHVVIGNIHDNPELLGTQEE